MGINLLGGNYHWEPALDTIVEQSNGEMNVTVSTEKDFKNYNRAELHTIFKLNPRPIVLNLNYSSNSIAGHAVFYVEIRDSNSKILWGTSWIILQEKR